MATRAVLLDIDGVLVVSWKPIPGAVEALRSLRNAGFTVVFLTNTTSRPAATVTASLRDGGFDVADDELVTAGRATAGHLAAHHPGARCLVLNEGPLDDLAGVDVVSTGDDPDAIDPQDVDVVVMGAAGPSFGWAQMNLAARAVLAGAALVGMHGTLTWRTDEGICVDGGAYLATLERATGATATVAGKPSPVMFREALRLAGVDAGDAVMVGDDLGADVLAAQAVGIRGVLVRTGKFRPEALDASPEQPDAVVDSIEAVPGLLGVAS